MSIVKFDKSVLDNMGVSEKLTRTELVTIVMERYENALREEEERLHALFKDQVALTKELVKSFKLPKFPTAVVSTYGIECNWQVTHINAEVHEDGMSLQISAKTEKVLSKKDLAKLVSVVEKAKQIHAEYRTVVLQSRQFSQKSNTAKSQIIRAMLRSSAEGTQLDNQIDDLVSKLLKK